MKEEISNPDVAKEFLTVLTFCENSFIDNIPKDVLEKLNDLAGDSLKEFYIDNNKSLEEQDLTNECKDLISLLYFMYMKDSSSQKEIINTWLNNEKNRMDDSK